HTDIADLAGMNEMIEGGQRLLDGGRRVPAVRLVEVDVVGLQPPQAPLAGADDPVPRKTFGISAWVHPPTALGGHDDGIALGGVLLEPAADDLLGGSLGTDGRVDIGGVDEVATALDVVVEQPVRGALIGLLAERHRSERELGDKEPGSSKQSLTHRRSA